MATGRKMATARLGAVDSGCRSIEALFGWVIQHGVLDLPNP